MATCIIAYTPCRLLWWLYVAIYIHRLVVVWCQLDKEHGYINYIPAGATWSGMGSGTPVTMHTQNTANSRIRTFIFGYITTAEIMVSSTPNILQNLSARQSAAQRLSEFNTMHYCFYTGWSTCMQLDCHNHHNYMKLRHAGNWIWQVLLSQIVSLPPVHKPPTLPCYYNYAKWFRPRLQYLGNPLPHATHFHMDA